MTQQDHETPEFLFTDAEQLLAMALRELDGGNIRQAVEKAWGAAKRATDALILARTGEQPRTTGQTTKGIRQLAREDLSVSPIAIGYANRAWILHGSCFYDGQCEPQESIAVDVQDTAEFIRDARRLAGGQSLPV